MLSVNSGLARLCRAKISIVKNTELRDATEFVSVCEGMLGDTVISQHRSCVDTALDLLHLSWRAEDPSYEGLRVV